MGTASRCCRSWPASAARAGPPRRAARSWAPRPLPRGARAADWPVPAPGTSRCLDGFRVARRASDHSELATRNFERGGGVRRDTVAERPEQDQLVQLCINTIRMLAVDAV